jgi:hypothetical protein
VQSERSFTCSADGSECSEFFEEQPGIKSSVLGANASRIVLRLHINELKADLVGASPGNLAFERRTLARYAKFDEPRQHKRPRNLQPRTIFGNVTHPAIEGRPPVVETDPALQKAPSALGIGGVRPLDALPCPWMLEQFYPEDATIPLLFQVKSSHTRLRHRCQYPQRLGVLLGGGGIRLAQDVAKKRGETNSRQAD